MIDKWILSVNREDDRVKANTNHFYDIIKIIYYEKIKVIGRHREEKNNRKPSEKT